jgi:hypothetical protein
MCALILVRIILIFAICLIKTHTVFSFRFSPQPSLFILSLSKGVDQVTIFLYEGAPRPIFSLTREGVLR